MLFRVGVVIQEKTLGSMRFGIFLIYDRESFDATQGSDLQSYALKE